MAPTKSTARSPSPNPPRPTTAPTTLTDYGTMPTSRKFDRESPKPSAQAEKSLQQSNRPTIGSRFPQQQQPAQDEYARIPADNPTVSPPPQERRSTAIKKREPQSDYGKMPAPEDIAKIQNSEANRSGDFPEYSRIPDGMNPSF